jgi:hypothetical protein
MEREDCPHLDIQQAGDGGAHQAKCDRESAYTEEFWSVSRAGTKN